MANKRLIRVPLNEVRTGDEEVLGSLYPHKGVVYRWVKNSSTTGLTATGPALVALTSVHTNVNKRVVSPDAGVATGLPYFAAGSPVTGIACSGSDTGDHGWIACKGIRRVSVQQLVTALAVGECAIASATYNAAFASVYGATANSATTANLYSRRIQLLSAVAATGAATAASAIADIQCL